MLIKIIWNVLYNKFIDKVRIIIPPEVSAKNSLVEWWDALSRHFILWEQTGVEPLQEYYKDCIKQLNDYVKNPNCNIIIFENPPYRDSIAENTNNQKWKTNKNFVYGQFLKHWTDKRFYKNELCLSQNTLSDEKLKEFELNHTDKSIIKLWNEILYEAKKTKNYNENFTYWLFQIIQELNTYQYNNASYTKNGITKLKLTTTEKKAKSIEYIELNTKIDSLKKFLKEYYEKQIQDKLFEFELLK